MIRTRLAHALALAALISAPAFAQSTTEQPQLDKAAAKQNAAAPSKQTKADATTTSTTSTAADVSAGTTTAKGAYVAPLEKNAAKQQAMADCADHPQAGKLADKSTGQAKEHSASPVHSDCVVDSKPAQK